MKRKYEPIFLLFFLSVSLYSQAQKTDLIQKVSASKPKFKLGVYYNSGLNYFGRVDSLHSNGVFPMAELWLTKEFYINVAPVFINNNTVSFQYAGTVTTAGYRFTSGNNKMGGHIYIVKPFYKDNSQLVQSALKAQAAFTLTWYNKIFNVTGGGDMKFSNKTDYGATAGIDHILRKQFDDQSVLVFDPSFYVYGGTQRFTETYYQNTGIPGVNQLVTKNTNRFTVLSYEFSMPIIYGKGKVQFLAIPAYVLPQNLVVIPGRTDLSERGEKLFYATLGVKINF